MMAGRAETSPATLLSSLGEAMEIMPFPTLTQALEVWNDYISRPVYRPPDVQRRFTRSKRKRIQKKWRLDPRNWGPVIYTLAKNPEASLRRMRRARKIIEGKIELCPDLHLSALPAPLASAIFNTFRELLKDKKIEIITAKAPDLVYTPMGRPFPFIVDYIDDEPGQRDHVCPDN